jgi:hypothetical protein
MKSSKTLRKKSDRGRIFTVEEANATLPLVRAIVSDLVELSRDVIDRRERLSQLPGNLSQLPGKPAGKPHDPYEEELAQMTEDVEKDSRQLREYVEELRAVGVEPSSATEGLVDFPSVINGRKIFLCWKLGEPQVAWWHDSGDGYRQRKPLIVGGTDDFERRGTGRCTPGQGLSRN